MYMYMYIYSNSSYNASSYRILYSVLLIISPTQEPQYKATPTHWHQLLLLINDLHIDLHVLVRPLRALVESPVGDGEVHVMAEVI